MKIFSKIENGFDNLSSREQKMVVATIISSMFMICGLFIFLISDSFSEREQRIDGLKGAIKNLYKNRGKVANVKDILASYEMKAIKKPPMLQGFIDTAAQDFELKGLNYNPKKPKDLGEHKEYHEESVEVKLHDVDLKKFSQLMDRVENNQYLIMVTELKSTSRRGHHDRLDSSIIVSSYYKRNAKELKELATDKKGKNEKRKKKGEK
ncbi:MAG: hypothetical protein JXR95_08720 [Deltaproteobacteria bacterium]|nr:hypothetical protein [Deltaproteobacteria bacterium]